VLFAVLLSYTISERKPLYAVARLSVGNTRALYSGDWNFPQYFYGIWYLDHPL